MQLPTLTQTLQVPQMIQVLVVEDEPHFANRISQIVADINSTPDMGTALAMETVGSLGHAIDHLASYEVDVVLLDVSLPDAQGIAAVEALSDRYPATPIIVMTNLGNWSSMIRGADAGGRDFLLKTDLAPELLFRAVYHVFERKQVEDRLRQTLETHQSLLDNLPVAAFRKDTFGRYLYANRVFGEIVGARTKDIIGHNDHEIFTGRSARALVNLDHELLETQGDISELEVELKTAAGKEFYAQITKIPEFDSTQRVCSIHGMIIDVTQRKQAEEQRRISDRFEGMESIAREIVHHVKNRLAPVALNASLLETKCESPEMIELCRNIISATTKSGETLQHLLMFSEDQNTATQPVELDLVFSELERFLDKQLPETIRFNMNSETGLWSVEGDFASLLTILENLCQNAWESMGQRGTLTVTAENKTNHELVSEENKREDVVLIRVDDTGQGITAAIRNRIFDPYFTTKDPERSMGMGLTNCMSLIRRFNGYLRLDPQFDAGARFELTLPAIAAPSQERITPTETIPNLSILLVDDEEMIVRVGKQYLEAKGFSVMTARNGLEALAKYSENQNRIDVIVTDIMMPQMDGIALTRAIREHTQTKPIFVSTGFESQDNLDQLSRLGIQGIVSKPFSPDHLVQRILQHCRPNT